MDDQDYCAEGDNAHVVESLAPKRTCPVPVTCAPFMSSIERMIRNIDEYAALMFATRFFGRRIIILSNGNSGSLFLTKTATN